MNANIDLETIRNEIPGLHETIYLNTGGTGPSPRCVTDAIVESYRFLEEHGPDARPIKGEVANRAEAARERLAGFLGANTDEIAFTRSVSEGMNIVAWGLPWQPGDEVIVSDQEHPTGLLPWFNLRDRLGINVRHVPLAEDPDALLQRIDDAIGPRTRLLSLSHVTAENGLRLPAKQISALAHERNVKVLFDGAQSLGQFPLDLHETDADFYAMTGHKWLLGGYGVGLFYTRRDQLEELAVSWTGAGATESLDRETGEHRWSRGARRFEFGNRLWPSYVGLGAAADYLSEIGLDAIEARSGEQSDALKRALRAIPGVTVLTPADPSLSTGIVCFEIEGMTGDQITDQLWERRKIVCRAAFAHRAVRISVAFFVDSNELDTVVEVVRELAAEAGQSRSGRSD
ncbi:MAG: aminotransferase class V-fold PLP-dependent enzyme [Nitrolancea sp.]